MSLVSKEELVLASNVMVRGLRSSVNLSTSKFAFDAWESRFDVIASLQADSFLSIILARIDGARAW